MASAFLPKSASRPSTETLNRSRAALGCDDADEQAVGPDDARILEAWHDEHDLENRSWEQVVGSSFASPFDVHPARKFDNSEISAVEVGVFMLRVGGSPHD